MEYSDKNVPRIPELSSETHEQWFLRMEVKLRGKEVFYCIEQNSSEYARSVEGVTGGVQTLSIDTTKQSEHARDSNRALSYMFDCVGDEDRTLWHEFSQVKDYWAHLKAKYDHVDETTARKYARQIQNFSTKPDETIAMAWDRLKDYRRRLRAAKASLSEAYGDDTLFVYLTDALSPEFEGTLDGLETRPSLSIEERLSYLKRKENKMKELQADNALWARKESPRPHSKCSLCAKPGHFMRRCPELEWASRQVQAKNRSKAGKPSKTRRKPSGFAARTESSTEDGLEEARVSKEIFGKTLPSLWAADTGASSHMSDNPSLFRQLKPTPTKTIRVGGGTLHSNQAGEANLVCEDGSMMILPDTLYVPGLGINLLSGRKLSESGLLGSFDSKELVFVRNGHKVITANLCNGLYLVKHVSPFENAFPSETVQEHKNNDYILWHRRFAHLGPDKIRQLHKVTTLKKPINVPSARDPCEVCALTKLTNRIPKSLSNRKAEILALIHVDTAGPLPCSLRKNVYFLSIVDNYTRRTWALPIQRKSDAIETLKTWVLEVELHTGARLKAARTDNAPELLKMLKDWRQSTGIIIEPTTIASSHQNGVTERNIRTVEDDVRALVKDANLPIEFWDEAAEYDAYLRNRTNVGPIVDGMPTTPEEAWTGVRPSIDHIRIFGCKCVSYLNPKTIPQGQRHDKLVDKGRLGVFMGFSTYTNRHVKVFSPELGRTERSSRVIFFENEKGSVLDLRIKGTTNDRPDRRPRGRPRNTAGSITPQCESSVQKDPQSLGVEQKADSVEEERTHATDIRADEDSDKLIDEGSVPHDRDPQPERTDIDNDAALQSERTDTDNDATLQSERTDTDNDATLQSERTDIDNDATLENMTPSPDRDLPCVIPSNDKSLPELDDRESTTIKEARPKYFTRSLKRRNEEVDNDPLSERDAKICKLSALIAAMMEDGLESQDTLSLTDWECAFPSSEVCGIKIPTSYLQAIKDPAHGDDWKRAIREELESLQQNETWQVTTPPKDANIVSAKWVFAIKTQPDGSIQRFKARLVARGFSQIEGLDFLETFAPTVRMDTLRIFLALVAKENLHCKHYDIKNAYTESHLDEKIFMAAPPGIDVKEGHVLCLLKSLYGLKQGARNWHNLIRSKLKEWGFAQSQSDPCLFTHKERKIRLLLYVDDIAAATPQLESFIWFEKKMQERFTCKDLGEIQKILGVRINRDRRKRTLSLDQAEYLTQVLDRYGITTATHKSKTIPIADYKAFRPPSQDDVMIDVTEYRQCIGSLMFAMVMTRPDVTFALGRLAQYMGNPAKHHGDALKSLMRYLKSTVSTGIRYGPMGGNEDLALYTDVKTSGDLTLYSDADWASDPADRVSISGCVATLYGGPISWSSKKQKSVATSSCESEYMALAACAKQSQWIASVLRDLSVAHYIGPDKNKVQILGDNQGALALVKNAQLHERSKHIDVSYHFVRDLHEKGKLQVNYVPTDQMAADGLTKPLARILFQRFKNLMGVWDQEGFTDKPVITGAGRTPEPVKHETKAAGGVLKMDPLTRDAGSSHAYSSRLGNTAGQAKVRWSRTLC